LQNPRPSRSGERANEPRCEVLQKAQQLGLAGAQAYILLNVSQCEN
jgi:hypothetical protein